jgi:hypothetical protein
MNNMTTVELTNELSELIYRAKKVNYKNIPPRLPKNPTESTMTGFHKRLRNWSNGLFSLEQETNRHNKRIVKTDINLLKSYTIN